MVAQSVSTTTTSSGAARSPELPHRVSVLAPGAAQPSPKTYGAVAKCPGADQQAGPPLVLTRAHMKPSHSDAIAGGFQTKSVLLHHGIITHPHHVHIKSPASKSRLSASGFCSCSTVLAWRGKCSTVGQDFSRVVAEGRGVGGYGQTPAALRCVRMQRLHAEQHALGAGAPSTCCNRAHACRNRYPPSVW